MIRDLPQNNLRVGYSWNELGKLSIVEPGRWSVYEDHYTSFLLLCMFETSYSKKFFKRGGRMDENVGECDHPWWAQGSHYTACFGVYLYVFTMKSCFDIVILKAILSAPPCCPRMGLLSTGPPENCTYSPSALVTVPAPSPPDLPAPHALGSGTAVSCQTLQSASLLCPLSGTSRNPVSQEVLVDPQNGLL